MVFNTFIGVLIEKFSEIKESLSKTILLILFFYNYSYKFILKLWIRPL
jgi:hypothetical protein